MIGMDTPPHFARDNVKSGVWLATFVFVIHKKVDSTIRKN